MRAPRRGSPTTADRGSLHARQELEHATLDLVAYGVELRGCHVARIGERPVFETVRRHPWACVPAAHCDDRRIRPRRDGVEPRGPMRREVVAALAHRGDGPRVDPARWSG